MFAHYEVIIEKREVLLLSDHRLMYCEKNDLFGGWQVRNGARFQPHTVRRFGEYKNQLNAFRFW